ncbi:MAG: NUDIX hydrolase, partial [Planctomycetota bacterium]
HPGAVVLRPMLAADTVVLIENQRPAVGETLLELPAGTRDRLNPTSEHPKGTPEPVLQTAARELTEETGFVAGQLDVWCEFYSAPGLGNESMHLVVARDLTAGPPKLETTERIVNRICTRDQITEMLREHRIRDAKTLVGLQAYLFQMTLDT